MSKRSRLILLTIVVFALCIPGSAATLGTFNMAGIVTVSNDTITWASDALGNAPNMFTLTLGTGIYSTEDGQNQITDLTQATEPVGTLFGPDPFISFLVDPSVSPLLINFINPGIYTSTDCFASTAVAGQNCTLPGSPFNFVNNTSTSSTATWNFSGVTADGNQWSAIFTSQFQDESFQQVIASLNGTGSVSKAYSAAEVTVSSTVPEPGPLSTVSLGAGLLMLSLSIRKYRRS
jgi:hypothetical protein